VRFSSERARKLDGELADPTDSAHDEHSVARPQAGLVDQSFPSRERHERHRGRLAKTDVLRSQGKARGIGRHELAQGTARTFDAAGAAVHAIADFKARDAAADFLNDPGYVSVEDHGEGGSKNSGFARADFRVDRVHACGLDFDEHFVGPQDGRLDLRGLERGGRTELFDDLSFHIVSPL